MEYLSTRDEAQNSPVTLSEALARGLAPDGGLYVPSEVPHIDIESFADRRTAAEVGEAVLAPFFEGDALAADLQAICAEAFDFPLPVLALDGGPSVLELFHGPTGAFKDVGARFLAACTQRLEANADRPLTILVATSGDTGSAVAAAFHRRPGIQVVILFPEGLVSARQAHLLSCWDDNVSTFRVQGTFDDCQRLVKSAFADERVTATLRLSSANSINMGRLLPQMVYYVLAALRSLRMEQGPPNFLIPTGNLGNAFACLLAREMGLPIGDVVLATNANRPIPDFLESGEWRPRPSVATLASAMDVGDPSNMERLFWRFGGHREITSRVRAVVVEDDDIRETIRRGPERWHQIWCPHTATAVYAWEHLTAARQALPWMLAATAHPAKFDDVVEPLIGRPVPVPETLAALLALPSRAQPLTPSSDALREALLDSR